MDTQTMAPKNIEERIVWYTFIYWYPLYFVGGLYVCGPVIGWLLFFCWVKRLFAAPVDGAPADRFPIPLAHAAWVIGMLVMLIALVIGHLDFGMSTGQLIKSSIGWAKGWALLAIFILAGSLPIRPELIYRAAMKLCLHSLFMIPIFILAWLLNLPQTLYVSPISIIGGPGPEFFAVSLYEIDPGSGIPRWRMFTPWAPALGFVANIFFVFALQEKDKFWQRVGIVTCVLMILMSQSRLAAVCLIANVGLYVQLKYISGVLSAFLLGVFFLLFAVFALPLMDAAVSAVDSFESARAGSTRVRQILGRIAIERWYSEAMIWGHGVVEKGPHLVEYMPIGSHHSWYGLLFVKGIVGFFALLIPLAFSFINILLNITTSPIQGAAVACCTLIVLYTFGENLEILSYLIWPALLVIGIAHKQSKIILNEKLAARLEAEHDHEHKHEKKVERNQLGHSTTPQPV
jgi:hypothetical protein